MKANMGTIDRIVRILIAVVIIVLSYAGKISGPAAIILLILSGVFVLTSLVSFCPLYLPFKISTKKKEK